MTRPMLRNAPARHRIAYSFVAVLGNHRIRVLQPIGEAFNPLVMEAIASEERAGLERDTVVEVYQAGYVMDFDQGDSQVLRPARVKVGKPEQAAQTSTEVNDSIPNH